MKGPGELRKLEEGQANSTEEPREQTRVESPNNPAEKLWLARAFGFDKIKDIETHEHRLDRLIKWAKEKGAKNPEDIFVEIRSLRNKLGSASIHDVNVWIGLQDHRNKLVGELMETDSKINKLHEPAE